MLNPYTRLKLEVSDLLDRIYSRPMTADYSWNPEQAHRLTTVASSISTANKLGYESLISIGTDGFIVISHRKKLPDRPYDL